MSDNIILLVGESGCGKTTVANILEEKYELYSIPSYTTRPKRDENEVGHSFVTDEEFKNLIAQEEIVGYTIFNEYSYCATASQVDSHDVYVIDLDGVEFFKQHYTGHKRPFVVYLQASEETRRSRMLNRGDKPLNVAARIMHDKDAFASASDVADLTISCDVADPEKIADVIYSTI